jgi:hypothetical protein
MDLQFGLWSDPGTWNDTLRNIANPLNVIEAVRGPSGDFTYRLLSGQTWAQGVPSAGDDVWIPPWKKVRAPTAPPPWPLDL